MAQLLEVLTSGHDCQLAETLRHGWREHACATRKKSYENPGVCDCLRLSVRPWLRQVDAACVILGEHQPVVLALLQVAVLYTSYTLYAVDAVALLSLVNLKRLKPCYWHSPAPASTALLAASSLAAPAAWEAFWASSSASSRRATSRANCSSPQISDLSSAEVGGGEGGAMRVTLEPRRRAEVPPPLPPPEPPPGAALSGAAPHCCG